MMHKESELSQWFTEVPPVRDGAYQVYAGYSKLYAYWTLSKGWGVGSTTPCEAQKLKYTGGRKDHYHSQGRKWRGLSYDPCLPKKLARRTDLSTSKEAAAKVVKSGTVKTHCAKIRACLVEHGRMTPSEIAAKLKMRRSSVFRRMSDLKRDGFASRTGEKRGGQSVWNAI